MEPEWSLPGLKNEPPVALRIGRDREMAVVDEFLTLVRSDGDAMFVVGDPGTGKSLLLEYAAQRASRVDIRVLFARGVEFEAEMSFSGLNQALLPLFPEFERLSTVHAAALNVALGLSEGPPPASLVVSNAVLAALQLAASRQPVLMIVDDLPWIDQASATVLAFVAPAWANSRRVPGCGSLESGELLEQRWDRRARSAPLDHTGRFRAA